MGKNILDFQHFNMSILPTPIQYLENISRELGANIWCKRDDLTGFAFGGNKTRKLDYLLVDAKQKRADTLIGIGAVQSNFCRLTASMGKRCGFDVELVLGGKKSKKPTANHMLDILFGAKIHYVDSEDWSDWESKAVQLEAKLIANGKKPYWMPIGGSSPIGALGYANAFREIMEDSKKLKINFDKIFFASASAGTQSGLLVGKAIYKWKGRIAGIGVAKDKRQLTDEVLELANKTGQCFGVKISFPQIYIFDDYMGQKYGDITKGCLEAVEFFASKEGIMLDYVYSGKAAAGLMDFAKQGDFSNNENILFIHTGGNVGLFR